MKISLVEPFLSTKDRYGSDLGKVGPTCEPLGLAYLAAAISEKRPQDEVEIIDTVALNYTTKNLIEYLKKNKPDIIGLRIITPMYLVARDTIRIIKDEFPNIKIIVGGPHVTIFPKQTLQEDKNIDICVIGEGEITIVELINALEKKISLSKIKGIAYRIKDKIKINPLREPLSNIDLVPLPTRNLLPMGRYKPAPTYYNKLPSYIMLTSRGCPYRCSYCSKIFGNLYRHHSIERIIKEMKILIEEYKAKEIIFRDDTFTINEEHVKKLCEKIIELGLNKKIKWTCMTRVNLVDLELLKLMKKAGCWSIHYGVESGSQRLLDLIDKGITIEQIKNAFKWTREAGIETKAFFMLGLPTETYEESIQTIKFSQELKPDWVQFTITVPYPGTQLYNIAQEDGTLLSQKWEDYQTWAGWSNKNLVYTPKGRDQQELKKLQTKAMRGFYFRPRFILRQMKNLKSFNNFKTYSLGAYALFKSKFK